MRTENLSIVFVDIAGFTSRTSSQTRDENKLMLRRFDEIVRPLVRAYNGRVVKTIGDAYLLTFRSPTEALLCSTAIHDRIAETDLSVDPSQRFTVRAAVNVGDVRIKGGDIFGEAVNIASRIEGKADAGEVYFSESVYLSMTRTEIPSEEVGYTELKGIPGTVRLYRIPRAGEPGGPLQPANRGTDQTLPFAGIGLSRVKNSLSVYIPTEVLRPAVNTAQGIFSTVLLRTMDVLSRFFSWWKAEIRHSRAVQYGTIIVVAGLVILSVWLFKSRHRTPFERLHDALGL